MGRFKRKDWRGGYLLQITQYFNIEVFKDIYWFLNKFAESLGLFLSQVGKMFNIKHF